MLALFSGVIWASLVTYLLTRSLRQFRAYSGAALPRSHASTVAANVSIIVPARDEAENIAVCLDALSAQARLSGRLSIIVVDDDSRDGTAAAAARRAAADCRIRLVAAGPLPKGWVGKPHACWRGALLADGDWLCFIDADVRAAPDLVAAAVAVAEAEGIDMLSLHPLQELGSFWERLVIPAGLLMIACSKPFRTSFEDAANGQFLLIRRNAYFQVGGHAAVRGEICEDKALAGRIREAGFCFRVLAAEPLARTRMYRGFGSLWEGLAKNATEILDSPGKTLAAGAAAFLFGWSTLLLPAAIAAALLGEPSLPGMIGGGFAVLGSAAALAVQCATARHFRMPACFGLIFALGYTVAACLACRSVLAQLNGRVTWKGRTYRLNKTSAERT
jgi:chlorobactene glucosyltransferase